MSRKISHLIHVIKNASRRKLLVILLIILVPVGYWIFSSGSKAPEGTIVVKKGTIRQEVKITGNTKPLESVALAFEQAGRIAGVNIVVGSHVSAGQTLAYLDQSELTAQLSEEQANVESEMAKLEEMKKGSRPEDVQIKQAALNSAKQALENQYQSVLDALNSAYIKTDDAVRKQLDTMFDNDETSNVTLSFLISNSQLKSNLENKRLL